MAKSKRCVLRRFLKVATDTAKWTNSSRLFQREGALAPVLILTLGTDTLVPLLDLSEQDGSDAESMINRVFVINDFVGKQPDLEQYSKFYW